MAPEGYAELRTGVVEIAQPAMRYYRLTGTDAMSWLQGQATNDVGLLQNLPWLDFCLTKPTGQLLAFCRAWSFKEGLLISTEQPEVLEQRVEETVFLEDVSLDQLDEPVTCLQGPRAEGAGLPSDRTGSGGLEVIGGAKADFQLSGTGLNLATLEAGMPVFGEDTTEKSLPPELGTAFDKASTSYSKGCYTGQEVLMRIKSRGHTNKTWVGLRLSGLPTGTEVEHEGKKIGRIHRSAVSPAFGHIASATIRNEIAEPGAVVSVDGNEATVVEMPFLR